MRQFLVIFSAIIASVSASLLRSKLRSQTSLGSAEAALAIAMKNAVKNISRIPASRDIIKTVDTLGGSVENWKNLHREMLDQERAKCREQVDRQQQEHHQLIEFGVRAKYEDEAMKRRIMRLRQSAIEASRDIENITSTMYTFQGNVSLAREFIAKTLSQVDIMDKAPELMVLAQLDKEDQKVAGAKKEKPAKAGAEAKKANKKSKKETGKHSSAHEQLEALLKNDTDVDTENMPEVSLLQVGSKVPKPTEAKKAMSDKSVRMPPKIPSMPPAGSDEAWPEALILALKETVSVANKENQEDSRRVKEECHSMLEEGLSKQKILMKEIAPLIASRAANQELFRRVTLALKHLLEKLTYLKARNEALVSFANDVGQKATADVEITSPSRAFGDTQETPTV